MSVEEAYRRARAEEEEAQPSEHVTIVISVQSARLLEELATSGIYGRDRVEVASRFVDQALQRFVETPKLKDQRRRPYREERF